MLRLDVGDFPFRTVASFVGKPAAIVVGMGFATNSTLIPCLLGKGGLIISDQLNHTSIVQGASCSRAKVKVFKHNDPASLENVIRNAIAEGQPGFEKYKPWNKIVSRFPDPKPVDAYAKHQVTQRVLCDYNR